MAVLGVLRIENHSCDLIRMSAESDRLYHIVIVGEGQSRIAELRRCLGPTQIEEPA